MNLTEKSLIDATQQAIGDQGRVLAAGVFQPRGSAGALTGGAILGSAARLIPGIGNVAAEAIQMAAAEGGYAARHGLAAEEGVPVYTLIAVTAEHLFAFRAKRDQLLGFKAGEPFATWDRDQIAISVHARAKVRTFEIHDLQTDQKYEMEAPRFSKMHGSLVVKLLMHPEDATTE